MQDNPFDEGEGNIADLEVRLQLLRRQNADLANRVIDLERFAVAFKEAVDHKTLQPKVLTADFARLCFEVCRLLPSTPEAGRRD